MISPLHHTAEQHPNLLAVSSADLNLSYRQLSARVLALGHSLRQMGLGPGSRLAVISHNSLEMMMLYWACIDESILFVPISPRFPLAQANQLLGRLGIDHLYSQQPLPGIEASLIAPEFSGQLAMPAPNIDENKPANIIFTSGSSGSPKAAVHSLANHIHSAQGAVHMIPLNAGDCWGLSLPLFHIGGLAIINRCALAGACVQLIDPQHSLASQIAQVTHLSLVPTQLQRLLEQQCQLSSLKAVLLGGGSVSKSLQTELVARQLNAYCSYGMTEMSSQICTGVANTQGLSGRLLPQRQLTIREGVIWVKGPTLCLGYLTAQGIALPVDQHGWFCTADCGHWSEDGQLQITGRVDNMFICGGENVHPEEIEAQLTALAEIEAAIVFAEPDVEFGHLPAAIIRWASATRLSPNELDAKLTANIARFKRPRHYYEWPTTVQQTGIKVNRQQVIAAIK
ncbi:o-succinylbenzoate--CoA ligase [Shewanella sp. NIFS-20-20]|uniref:o-succinylbenzoate--CoA ligase n=1 Tax=Shewanella sp. NIFS-20-20 TaxID=2853806 RepID=UPI001C4819BE|nr:o-succinylbenzoate--CoA ligase [Shewanella sp. NIFS-20-20]MBV7316317.1 o-succinylbenzoate--CoA ligase [Shewanella sp. NIFS-20-20]